MNVLVTSARTPFALDVVRKLAEQGHTVFASDTYKTAPGTHSRYLAGHVVTASPQKQTARFIDDVKRVVTDNQIDLVLPCFEEAFYLATRHDELSTMTTLYTGRFAALARLHDKATFQQVAQDAGLPIPQTIVATSDAELADAAEHFPHYFARAAFSRGGVELLTNTGPLAGHMDISVCHPTPDSPWLVQEFVDGPMVCTYSTLHGGRVTAHSTYRAPRQWQHSTGIEFLSIDGGPSLEVVQALGSSLDHTGQLSFDFVDSPDGLRPIECNPRTTDGALLLTGEELATGIIDPDAATVVVPPGRTVQLDFAVLAEIFTEGLRKLPTNLRDLVHVRDASGGWHDHLPALYSFLAFAHHARLGHKERKGVFEAMSDDIVWNGEPIEGMTDADAAVLDELHAAAGG